MATKKSPTLPQPLVALVTGASRGIGQAISLNLGQAGYTVIGTATTETGAQAINSTYIQHNITGQGVVMNVCDQEQVKTTLSTIQQQFGAPLLLINNAGVTRDNLLLRMKQSEWDDVLTTNLTGVYYLTKLCLRAMLKARWGRIVNVSSIVATIGNAGQTNYVAAKAGLIGFTKALAKEVAAYGITVNAIAPGFIDTDMTNKLNEEQQQKITDLIPMQRIGEVADIAHAAMFLASQDSSYITGQTLHVNGGMCMV